MQIFLYPVCPWTNEISLNKFICKRCKKSLGSCFESNVLYFISNNIADKTYPLFCPRKNFCRSWRACCHQHKGRYFAILFYDSANHQISFLERCLFAMWGLNRWESQMQPPRFLPSVLRNATKIGRLGIPDDFYKKNIYKKPRSNDTTFDPALRPT